MSTNIELAMGGRTSNPNSWQLAWLAIAGAASFALPLVYDFYREMWSRSGQDYGPLVLAFAGWHLYTSIQSISGVSRPIDLRAGIGFIVAAAIVMFCSRWLSVLALSVISLQLALVGVLAMIGGRQAVRACWFTIFFLCFLIPLPGTVTDLLTQPMKQAVSAVVVYLLSAFDMPVGRSGVVLYIGQYRLLVADACAGLTTLFTLEAFGLFYINLTKSASVARNVALGILVVPVSFAANVIRVATLCLVTYYFGDAAGQGFIHNFSGVFLFAVALVLLIAIDAGLKRVLAAD